jgi:uncharacterized membrane protein YvbJ
MKICPFCMGDIRDEAVKCVHCGEWVEEPQDRREQVSTGSPRAFFRGRDLDETLNEGVKVYAKVRIISVVIAAVLFLVFLLVFVLPTFNKAQDVQNQLPTFPSVQPVHCQPGFPGC